MYGIIGGSGLTQLSSLDDVRREVVRTPYGEPSGPLTCGQINGVSVVFLARHGYGHTIPPHQVNYRANIWALKEMGATEVVSVASVGGIRADLGPGRVVVPDQLIDYTWGRASTYFEGEKPVTHIDFTQPYTGAMRARILAASVAAGVAALDGGVYASTQGPRLETAAEINRLEDLRQINDHVRPEEIEGMKAQLAALEEALGSARLRLDALRLVLQVA